MSNSRIASRRRLIFVSQLYDPEPTVKGVRFVEALERAGFDVEVLTGFPNYPGGTVYKGYKIRPLKKEVINSTKVTRVLVYPSHDRNPIKRMLCYFSFFISSLLYLIFVAKKADLIYVSYPSLTTGLAAVGAKLFRGTPVVLDIQDLWPDSLSATGMVNSGYFICFVGWLCKILYRRVDHIIVQSPGFRKLLIDRRVPDEKISVILNWADEKCPEAQPEKAEGFDQDNHFRILFAGNMGAAQGLETVIDAADLVFKTHTKIVFYFLGSGIALESLKARVEKMSLTNVRFLPRVGLDEVQNYLASADCLLVHLKSSPLFKLTIPSKTQAYFYASKPIVMAVEGDAAELVTKAGAGLSCASGNPKALAETVIKMANLGPARRLEMGRSGRSFYDRELTIKHYIQVLLNVFENVWRPKPLSK